MSEREVPDGFHLEWVEEKTGTGHLDWRLATEEERATKRCRWSDHGKVCGRPPVAAILRGTSRPSWWFYCEQHLYGRRIRDGRIEFQRLVKDEE